jgi:hypothetical protein
MRSNIRQILYQPDKAVDVKYITSANSGVDGTSFTFAATNLGPAFLGRKIVVGVNHRETTFATITSLTINGVTASLITGTNVLWSASNLSTTALYQADVPNGFSGDIVVTTDLTVLRVGIGVWSVKNGRVVSDTGTSTSDPASDTLVVPARSGVIGYSAQLHSSGSNDAVWTGVTEAFDATVENTHTHSGANANITVATSLAVACDWASTPATGSGVSYVVYGP